MIHDNIMVFMTNGFMNVTGARARLKIRAKKFLRSATTIKVQRRMSLVDSCA